ncbi:MAG: LiaF-related protein [Bacteroidota bacterium]|nr:LiaF-related protein [Bacteroidota bacterium]
MKRVESRIVLGIILIIIGLGYFISNIPGFEQFEIHQYIFSFEFIVFAVGLILFLNSSRRLFGALVLSVGVILMAAKFLGIGEHIFFPLIIIALGIYILLKHNYYKDYASEKKNQWHEHMNDKRFYKHGRTIDKDMIDETAIFGGGNRFIKSDNFKGGFVTCIFGGMELDLTNSTLAEGEVVLDVTALFGGAEILVPKEWDVRNQGTPIFGGFSIKNKKYMSQEVRQNSCLVIKGIAIFGGVEIKYY